MSLLGGVIGLAISKNWGGFKSLLGKSLAFFSLGLLAQFFGQAAYAYLIYVKNVAVPYPSIGDLGYFGSIIFYIVALIYLGKVVRIKKKLISVPAQLLAYFIPIALLAGSYLFFLQSYSFSWSNPLKMILDFGYPLGEAIYVSMALVILILSRSMLGGIMRKPILFLVFTLVIQYFCDFMFLYQSNKGEWYVGGINDYLYFVSYFCMTIAVICIGGMFYHIKEG